MAARGLALAGGAIPAMAPIAKRSRSLLLLLLPTVVLALLTVRRLLLSAPPTVTASVAAAAPTPDPAPRVTLWLAPPACRGAWQTARARDSPAGFPYAVVRDAVFDRRPRARALLAARDRAGAVRVVLYVTAHLSVRLTSRNAAVDRLHAPRLVGHVEYVTWLNGMIVPNVKGKYYPGMKTRYGAEVSSWQVGLRLNAVIGSATQAVQDAIDGDERLVVRLPIIRFDEVVIPLVVNMSVRCVMGWTMPGLDGVPETCGPVGEKAANAKGSILFSGSALHGAKKRDDVHLRGVANFAARGLLGPLRFDYVAMSVISDVSASDMHLACGADHECWKRQENVNEALLRRIRDVAEEEMRAIGVPRALFPRLLLIPTCRLGSDAARSEKGDPCGAAEWHGQYHAMFFSYAMLAPFFKWAASHDIDEYFSAVPAPGGVVRPAPAAVALDAADAARGAGGALTFGWLNMRVASVNATRTLSRGLVRGRMARLRHRNVAFWSRGCVAAARRTGKSAVRCDVGLGFTIHHPVVAHEQYGIRKIKQGTQLGVLRTWHARLKSASGDCEYAEEGGGDNDDGEVLVKVG